MSNNGNFIAISGSESDTEGDTFRGFVKLYGSDNTLLYKFETESIDEVAPIVNVAMSGNGKRLAIGAVFPTGNSTVAVSGVKVYDLTEENKYGQIGDIIAAGIMGDLPGLRLDMSEDGSRLIVGGRNHDNGSGRVRVYTIDTSTGEAVIKVLFQLAGAAGSEDHLGSSVSTSRTGKYVAIGGTGVVDSAGSRTGAVKVYNTNTNERVGGAIYGTSASDATGFSVDLVEIEEVGVLYVAVASIFSGVEGHSDRGNVDIYTLSSDSDKNAAWNKVGKSLDGDRGATLDFEKGRYHIGDSFGFSLGLAKMKDDSLRVAVGSPFFSNVRESDGILWSGEAL